MEWEGGGVACWYRALAVEQRGKGRRRRTRLHALSERQPGVGYFAFGRGRCEQEADGVGGCVEVW